MKSIFLMRHAEAESGPRNDPTRLLTETGKRDAATMGRFLCGELGTVELIITSYFARALITANIIGESLGCTNIQQTPWLEPSAPAEKALSEIRRLNGDKSGVIVVTHHPLIGELVAELCGAKTDEAHVVHGSVLHIDGDKVAWFVTPRLVDREDHTAVVEAALKVADAVLGESLRHPKHADKLIPIRKAGSAVLSRYFKKQGKEFLKTQKDALESLAALQESRAINAGRYIEATKDESDAAVKRAVTYIPIVVNDSMGANFSDALKSAVTAGYDTLAEDFGSDAEIKADVVQQYLADHSLQKLSGNLDDTSLDRLRSALSDAYKKGADFDGLKKAVTDTFEDFSTVRADMIAQTEMNDAYNAGRAALGLDIGANEKSWSCDGDNPCPECLDNQDAGWIPLSDFFPSGDEIPTAHPGCFCSADFRINNDAYPTLNPRFA